MLSDFKRLPTPVGGRRIRVSESYTLASFSFLAFGNSDYNFKGFFFVIRRYSNRHFTQTNKAAFHMKNGSDSDFKY